MNADRGCAHAEQAVALGLHALEPADEAALLAHVPTCPVCQDLVRQTQEVVLGLGASAEQRDPPARLRAGLMQAVAATAQVPPEHREQPWAAAVPETRAATDPGGPPPVVERPRPNSPAGWARRRRLIAIAATIAVALVGAGGVAMELVERQGQETVVAAPPAAVDRVLTDLDRSGARHAVLRSPAGKPLAAVVQYQGERQVMPFAMEPNAADNTVYVLWGIAEGHQPVALGTFDVTAPSSTMLPVGSPGKGDQYPSYGISIENSRTAPATPGLVVASGQVAS